MFPLSFQRYFVYFFDTVMMVGRKKNNKIFKNVFLIKFNMNTRNIEITSVFSCKDTKIDLNSNNNATASSLKKIRINFIDC